MFPQNRIICLSPAIIYAVSAGTAAITRNPIKAEEKL
jgi:hypothetical protein